jgi:hypothetical protein
MKTGILEQVRTARSNGDLATVDKLVKRTTTKPFRFMSRKTRNKIAKAAR